MSTVSDRASEIYVLSSVIDEVSRLMSAALIATMRRALRNAAAPDHRYRWAGGRWGEQRGVLTYCAVLTHC